MTMQRWDVLDASGQRQATVTCEGHPSEHEDYEGWDWVELTASAVSLDFDPLRDDLVTCRAHLQAKVKQRREAAKDGGILTPWGPLQTDPDSRTNINGAVQMATILGENFSVGWRMDDEANTVVTFDAVNMINMGLMVGQHINACQLRKNELDAAIAAAVTLEELNAIDLEAGWP